MSAADPVVVLLSSYNGASFIDAQIASILRQTWRNLRLIIRDDGSMDGTWDIIQSWSRDPRVLAFQGPPLGAKGSFLHMLGMIDSRHEYVAFADQDDVWLTDKLERAMTRLGPADCPMPKLFCTRSFLTDHRLSVIGKTPLWPRPPSFGNALVENIATGCTVVLNPAAAQLVRSAGAPQHSVMHDWWCYLIVSAFGSVLFDPRPSILLRQHGQNLVGVATSAPKRWIDKIARQFRQDSLSLIVNQALSFKDHFGLSMGSNKACGVLLETLAHGDARERRALAAERALHRQFPVDDLLLRLRLLAGPWPQASLPIDTGSLQKVSLQKVVRVAGN